MGRPWRLYLGFWTSRCATFCFELVRLMHDGRAGARTKRSHLADADVDGGGGRRRELLGWCDMKDRAVQLPVYNKQYIL